MLRFLGSSQVYDSLEEIRKRERAERTLQPLGRKEEEEVRTCPEAGS